MKRITLGVVMIMAAFLSGATPGRGAERPNLLVLIADDVDQNSYGCYGNRAIRTPNIDALARRGVLCRRAFLTTPQCSPTRISILSGLYAHATGAEDLHMPLPEGVDLLPTPLRAAGYFTGHMMKTHYGPNGDKQFDWYDKGLEKFGRFLDEAGDRPFFMWVGFRDAHRPYSEGAFDPPHDPDRVVVPPYLADTPETRADLALYYDEVARMDSVIGRFVAELGRRGMRENTLIVFLGDNGMPFPRAKGTLYDSGVGTPYIWSWPAKLPEGAEHEGLESVIDLAPTLMTAAGVTPPAGLHGSDMIGRLVDPALPGREHVFSERNWHNCDEHMRSVRTENFRLIRNAYTELPHGTAADLSDSPSWASLKRLKDAGLLAPQQRQIFTAPRPSVELYDLRADPREVNNVAEDPFYAGVRRELEAELDRWGAETGDFPPEFRRRADNTDRVTGEKFTRAIAPMTNLRPGDPPDAGRE